MSESASKPHTESEYDVWEEFSYLWDHTDVYLVRDALAIANGPDSDFIKIGKLQLLVSAWEDKTFSSSRIDGSGNLLLSQSGTTTGDGERVSENTQGESQSLLETVLPEKQGKAESQTQGVRQEEQSEGEREV